MAETKLKINERLLTAWSERVVPHQELLALVKSLKGTTGEERRMLQNRIADEIERRYPLREQAFQNSETEK